MKQNFPRKQCTLILERCTPIILGVRHLGQFPRIKEIIMVLKTNRISRSDQLNWEPVTSLVPKNLNNGANPVLPRFGF